MNAAEVDKVIAGVEGHKIAQGIIANWNPGDVLHGMHAANQLGVLAKSEKLSRETCWSVFQAGFSTRKLTPEQAALLQESFNRAFDMYDREDALAIFCMEHANDNQPQSKFCVPRGNTDPFEISHQGGLLQKITEWILDTARVPVREFATISTLAFLGALFGRRYVTPTGLGLNVYMVGVAGPSFGKDHARGAIEMLADDCGMPWLIGPGDVTSDSAIEKAVRRAPVHVMPMDEFGALLQGVTGSQATSWNRTVRKSFLELYSRSTKRWTGKEKADDKKDSSPIFFPTVSLLGFSTPTDFYTGITEQSFNDGFIARLTIIDVKNAPQRKRGRPVLVTPRELVEAVQAAYMLAPLNELQRVAVMSGGQKPKMHVCDWGEGAEDRWLEIENWQLECLDRYPDKEGILGRAAEQTQKFATLRAVSRNPAAPVVEIGDVEWSYAIVQRSLDTIEDGAAKYMVGSESEALRNAILRAIEKAGSKGIAYSDLTRAKGVKAARPYELEASLKWLEEGEQMRATRRPGARGRAGTRYFLSS